MRAQVAKAEKLCEEGCTAHSSCISCCLTNENEIVRGFGFAGVFFDFHRVQRDSELLAPLLSGAAADVRLSVC
jgi:hypothetical protein